MKGHIEIRPASNGQFKVFTVASNGEIVQISERLTSHQNCLVNILSVMDTYNGQFVHVRDYTAVEGKDGFSLYKLNADGYREYPPNPEEPNPDFTEGK